MKKIILLALIFAPLLGYSQEKMTITGKVTYAIHGDIVPGGIVRAKKYPKIGVLTDFDGNYTITVPKDVQTLVFSYIGRKTKEEKINGRTVINVALEEEEAYIVCCFGVIEPQKPKRVKFKPYTSTTIRDRIRNNAKHKYYTTPENSDEYLKLPKHLRQLLIKYYEAP